MKILLYFYLVFERDGHFLSFKQQYTIIFVWFWERGSLFSFKQQYILKKNLLFGFEDRVIFAFKQQYIWRFYYFYLVLREKGHFLSFKQQYIWRFYYIVIWFWREVTFCHLSNSIYLKIIYFSVLKKGSFLSFKQQYYRNNLLFQIFQNTVQKCKVTVILFHQKKKLRSFAVIVSYKISCVFSKKRKKKNLKLSVAHTVDDISISTSYVRV